jgi:hypothetical protein
VFIAKVGLNWLDPRTGRPVRVEVGDRCEPPEKSQKWLLEQGLIEPVKPKQKGAD